jgi:hypothetical protein
VDPYSKGIVVIRLLAVEYHLSFTSCIAIHTLFGVLKVFNMAIIADEKAEMVQEETKDDVVSNEEKGIIGEEEGKITLKTILALFVRITPRTLICMLISTGLDHDVRVVFIHSDHASSSAHLHQR